MVEVKTLLCLRSGRTPASAAQEAAVYQQIQSPLRGGENEGFQLSNINSSASTQARLCTAWSTMIASYSSSNDLRLSLKHHEQIHSASSIALQWDSSVGVCMDLVEKTLNEIFETLRERVGSSQRASIAQAHDAHTEHRLVVAIPRSQPKSDDLIVECWADGSNVHVRAVNAHDGLDRLLLSQSSRHLEYILRSLCVPESVSSPLLDLKAITLHDLGQIWSWNAEVAKTVEDLPMHELFQRRAQQHPKLPAIAAHDGNLSYEELDSISTRLAEVLVGQGTQPNSLVLVFIEKSMWVPVAQLAIMKAGCVATILDASLPLQRQQSIASLAQPAAILVSPTYQDQASALKVQGPSILVSSTTSTSWPSPVTCRLPKVSGSAWLYLVFTSGSTGVPKGAIISHANYVSTIFAQQKGLDFREFDRVFDFASYAFDAAWCNVLHCMAVGGCLCIPSDDERKGDLAAALRKYQVTYAVLTPSVAWMPASELPGSLRTIHFGGEPLKKALVQKLSKIRVINAYGPAECSTVSTAIVTDPEHDEDPTIGTGLGCCTWVVKIDGSELAPLGEIGELWMEGPIVGQGYLRNPEKTAAAFVTDPPWLTRGCPSTELFSGHTGRRGHLYRSGDLVRYRANGTLDFVGRKDSQVKIRGQRVELGEIEHNLQRAMSAEATAAHVQIMAEVIKPADAKTSTLVSFLFLHKTEEIPEADEDRLLSQAIEGLEDRLAKIVPPYMIPSVFFPIKNVPMTPTGKVDRRGLREAGINLYQKHLEAQPTFEQTSDESKAETALREIWSEVLGLPGNRIGFDTAFTRLGGDSITAMQVVSRCRARNMSCTVSNILKLQTISKIAVTCRPVQERKVWSAELEDTSEPWPLTPIQQILFENNPEGMNHYSLSYIVKLTRTTSLAELNAALLALTTRHGMLRARFSRATDGSRWQQYLAPTGTASYGLERHDWIDKNTMQQIVNHRQANLDLVSGPVFAVDAFEAPGEEQTLLMSAHHAIMDLVSWRVIWHDLTQYLRDGTMLSPPEPSFKTWCWLQRDEAERLDPNVVLPFKVERTNLGYWSLTPEELLFRDSGLNISILPEKPTDLLLGVSNDAFNTEPLDILVGTLMYCFAQTFPDRSLPAIFLEGHGREPVSDVEGLDLSETVGWFTSIFPVQVDGELKASVLDMIKSAKDVRRSIPDKGRPYFAHRFHNQNGRKAFEGHDIPEIIFNYRGSFQQLEDVNSAFQLEDRPGRDLEIPGDGADYRRPSVIDINLVVQEGKLQVWTRYPKNIQRSDAIVCWVESYTKFLTTATDELRTLPKRCTLADFPRLNISYAGLESLTSVQLVKEGIRPEEVQDILPCTPMQEGIVFSSTVSLATYSTVSIWRVDTGAAQVDVTRLANAWKAVTRAHPILATVFSTHPDSGRFVQIVLESANEPVIVTSGDQTAVEHLVQLQYTGAPASRPACDFTIAADHDGVVACRLDISHSLMDALSLPVLVQDIQTLYSGKALPVRTPFSAFVEYLSSTSSSNRLAYWKDYLVGTKPSIMPGDLSRNVPLPPGDIAYGWLTLPPATTASIAEICRDHELTRSVFLHVAWALVLAYFTGEQQACFGYLASGRDTPIDGVDGVVGPLISMLIARLDLGQSLEFVVDAAKQYNTRHLDAQHTSLAEIQHEINTKQLFNTNVTLREARSDSTVSDDGMRLIEVEERDPHEVKWNSKILEESNADIIKYDVVVSAALTKDDTEVSLQYRKDRFSLVNAQAIRSALEVAVDFLGVELTPIRTSRQPAGPSLYEAFFLCLAGSDEETTAQAWKNQFADLDAGCSFPKLSSSSPTSRKSVTVSHEIQNIEWEKDSKFQADVLASWALLQASYTGSKDVLFGFQPSNTTSITHPLPVPVRIQVEIEQNISEYLDTVQRSYAECLKLPHLVLHRLSSLGDDLTLAQSFQTVITTHSSTHGKLSTPDADIEHAQALSLNFTAHHKGVTVSAAFDEAVLNTKQVARLLQQFETVLQQFRSCSVGATKLADLETASLQDLESISIWNGQVYEQVQDLIPDLISKTARIMPDAPAISAWNGSLTYKQLDRLSDRLASYLIQLGIGPEIIVPMLFEKSVWTPVSAVAIIKAGGAGVMIDSTQPIERIRDIIGQTDAKLILHSKTNFGKAADFENAKAFLVNQASLDELPEPVFEYPLARRIQPSNLLYVSFTSGSTGKPKGVMITHSQFASAIKHQQTKLGFKRGQRVYDFASYAFDVAWSNLLHSLTSGSCLCIPSEDERIDALSDSIKNSKATLMNITPSMLRHLDPQNLPDLQQILLGGEAWVESDFLDWIDATRLINAYGAGECTIKTCLLQIVRGNVPNLLGRGVGLHGWIVRTDGSERLAPIGSVGELWLEGPQVGRGYLGETAKTATTFVTKTLGAGKMRTPRRFYRTGDLFRYENNGDLVFVSRKDSQVKIRGQRTEPAEIEGNVQRALTRQGLHAQVVIVILKPQDSVTNIVIAFLKAETDRPGDLLSRLNTELTETVPGYMIPSTYIVLENFPMTTTGKIHRKQLQQEHSKKTLGELVALNALRVSAHRVPDTKFEKLLAELYARILKREVSSISADDSFFRIGGDSLGAMRLVSEARKQGITLSVADIFKRPELSALAEYMGTVEIGPRPVVSEIKPFTLLIAVNTVEHSRAEAARLCEVDPTDVEDIFPCTPLQAGLLAETVRRPGDNTLTQIKTLKSSIDVERLKTAWHQTMKTHPILRTRIVDLPQHGLVQVVISADRCIIENAMTAPTFGLGTPLVACHISSSGFSWSIHHALYDGWSEPLLFQTLSQHYQGQHVRPFPQFQSFIKSVYDCTSETANSFWAAQFDGFSSDKFPIPPSATYKPKCDHHISREISGIKVTGSYTMASRLRLAWAILLTAITNSNDASFAATVSGRQAEVPDIELIAGPTFSTVPVRIAVDRSQNVKQLLLQVQLQAAEMIPFEQVGIQNIRRVSDECELGCQVQTHIVIQNRDAGTDEDTIFEKQDQQLDAEDEDRFKLYPICLEFFLHSNGVGLRADVDSNVVSAAQISRLVDRFEIILRQLSLPEFEDAPISSLNLLSDQDTQLLKEWCDYSLKTTDKTVHSIFADVVARQPFAPAVCSWDGNFTYFEVDVLSTGIAQNICQSSAPAGSGIVALMFEKSKWTSVCQVAVMKSGSASVVLSSTLPSGRQQVITDLAKPHTILTSPKQESRARQIAPPDTRIIVVGDSKESTLTVPKKVNLPSVTSDALLYLVFTSGSTGTPKGATLNHANLATAFENGHEELGFNKGRRVLDFASYAFDVSWLNLIYTLCSGACLCVPSQFEIENELQEAITRRRVNYAILTPTVAKLLHGIELETMHFGGEVLPLNEIQHWKDHSTALVHSYGPSECTPISVAMTLDPSRNTVLIGKGLGVHTWIVEPEEGKTLSAVGDVGELWLEGPLVGQGYFGDDAKTEAAFIETPRWALSAGTDLVQDLGRSYRTGDLVRFTDDGLLEFIGRKDGQIKIRGQRVELDEIEHHISAALGSAILQVVVDSIVPSGSSNAALVAFLHVPAEKTITGSDQAITLTQELALTTRTSLASILPSYMIPNGWLLVNDVPYTASKKVDRGKLRQYAASLQKEDLFQNQHEAIRKPESPEEIQIHALVAQVLSRDATSFGMNQNFIQLGGDSIGAMRLASLARQSSLQITVSDILTAAELGELVNSAVSEESEAQDSYEPFSLLATSDVPKFLEDDILPHIHSGHGKLVDVLPVTDMQASYLADNLCTPPRSWFYHYINFSCIEDDRCLLDSIERLVEHCEIYRTAFVRHGDEFFQAVFDSWKPQIDVVDGNDNTDLAYDELVVEGMKQPLQLGAPLVRFSLIQTPDGEGKLVFGMSHAIYDALSYSQTFRILADLYNGTTPDVRDFSRFVNFTRTHRQNSYPFWNKTLQGSVLTELDRGDKSHVPDGPPRILTRPVPIPQPIPGVTPATRFTYACAYALHRLTASTDITFGRVVSGRANLPASLQEVVGPCLNRVPVRVHFDAEQSRTAQLTDLQKQATDSIMHENTNILDIAANCENVKFPSDIKGFNVWCQYQNVEDRPSLDLPGVTSGLKHKQDEWEVVPMAANSVEMFARPDKKSDSLMVTVLIGPGHGEKTDELLDRVCESLMADD